MCMYIKHIHNTDFSSLWNSYNQILTVHCHCCCLCGTITIKIERDAAVVHHLYSFTNWSCNHCIVVCTIDILITFVESILCRWVGLCTAGDTERFIHKNGVVSEIGCHNGVYWVVVYNEFKSIGNVILFSVNTMYLNQLSHKQQKVWPTVHGQNHSKIITRIFMYLQHQSKVVRITRSLKGKCCCQNYL